MKGIIFDFNGTLFWDSKYNTEAWITFSGTIRDHPLTNDEMKILNGRNNRVFLEYIAGRKITEDEYEKWSEGKEILYRKNCKEDVNNFHLAPGLTELLDFLKENHILMGIASMAGEGNINFYIENFNLLNWFEKKNIIFDDGKIPGKPDPTIYLIAAKQLNLDPKDCVVVEDSTHGIEAAQRAGIGMIISLGHEKDLNDLVEKYGVHSNINDFTDFDRSIFQK